MAVFNQYLVMEFCSFLSKNETLVDDLLSNYFNLADFQHLFI